MKYDNLLIEFMFALPIEELPQMVSPFPPNSLLSFNSTTSGQSRDRSYLVVIKAHDQLSFSRPLPC